jgi:acetoin utilization protein AcuB
MEPAASDVDAEGRSRPVPSVMGTTNMRVRDVMARNPITIDPEAPLETAVAVMLERRVRHLPVVDDQGRLVGIVTDRDLRSATFGPAITDYLPTTPRSELLKLAISLNDVRVRHVMTWGAVTSAPDALVAQAAAVMVAARVGSLPVVEDKQLVGIVTEHDLLKAMASTLPSVKDADSLW